MKTKGKSYIIKWDEKEKRAEGKEEKEEKNKINVSRNNFTPGIESESFWARTAHRSFVPLYLRKHVGGALYCWYPSYVPCDDYCTVQDYCCCRYYPHRGHHSCYAHCSTHCCSHSNYRSTHTPSPLSWRCSRCVLWVSWTEPSATLSESTDHGSPPGPLDVILSQVGRDSALKGLNSIESSHEILQKKIYIEMNANKQMDK